MIPPRLAPLLVLVAVATVLPACQPQDQDGPRLAGDAKRREPTRVRTALVEQREMVKTLTTTTVVESENEIRIFPRVTGVVVEVHVEEGDEVQEGALLALIDARDSAAVLAEMRVALREAEDRIETAKLFKREAVSRVEGLKAACDQAKRDFERNQKNRGLISESALDALQLTCDRTRAEYETALLAADRAQLDEKAAHTAVERSRIQLGRQELNHSYTRILAPFAGVIASRAIKIGDTVTSGEVLGTGTAAFVLTDTEHLRAVINRPQRELVLFAPDRTLAALPDGSSRPQPSAEIRATAEALPGYDFRGLIRLVSPSIDATSGNFRVTIAFDRPPDLVGPWLLPGMLVRLEIVTDHHAEALVVPKRALRREGDVTLLFVARDGIAHRVEVDEGFSDEESVEVLTVEEGALAANDTVIVVGNRDLEDGDEIKVVEARSERDPTPQPKPEAEADADADAEPEDAASAADDVNDDVANAPVENQD